MLDARENILVAGQRAVDERTLLAELERADFVLLGGAHDNLDHHRLQARLVEALGRGGGTTLAAVAFETIETDQQTVLVEQLDRGNVAALGQVLHWEQPGGRPALVDYRPILQAAQDAGAEIVAAGLPMATVIFGGAQLGVLIIPLMIYHMAQLIICSAYVSRKSFT